MSHGAHSPDANDPFQRKVALTMSVFAVALAFVTNQASGARAQSLLMASESTNQWAYFQSKSTKGMLAKAEADLLDALAPATTDVAAQEKLTTAKAHFLAEAQRYDTEKDTIKADAERIVAERNASDHEAHQLEWACIALELAIVIATVSMVLNSRRVYVFALVSAAAGLLWTAKTELMDDGAHAHVAHADAKGEAHAEAH